MGSHLGGEKEVSQVGQRSRTQKERGGSRSKEESMQGPFAGKRKVYKKKGTD